MPHGHCFLWRPDILFLNIGSDIGIALAYFAIPFALIYFVRKRKDMAFNWIFVMFALFIVSCGLTHVMEIVTIWNPLYGYQGLLKLLTAGVSLTTALALVPLMPKALSIPSLTDLEKKNSELLALNERLNQANRSRLHQVIEAAPSGLLMVDQGGKIVLCNALVESSFGYSGKELIGKSIEVLVPEKFRLIHSQYRDGFFERPEARQMGVGRDLAGVRKDGTEFPIEIGLNPVEMDDGRFVLASVVDITERKAIEEKLHEAITSRELFMSIVSHELKTPLTSLGLHIQMARRKISSETNSTLSPETLARIFEISENQVIRLTGIIDDMLDVTSIQSSQLSFHFEQLNLSELVRSIVGRYSEALLHAKLPLTLDIDDGIVGDFDPLRIEQVIGNLVTNAIKYAPERPIKIALKGHGNYAKLTVEDEGPGIPP